MLKAIRLLVSIVVTLTALTASSASANHIVNASPAGWITMTSLGALTFDTTFSDVTCDVTLTGEIDRETDNLALYTLGSFGGWESSECEGASSITFLWFSTWWRLASAWAGPSNSVAAAIERFEFNLENIFGGLECLYGGEILISVATSRSGVTGLVTSGANSIFRGGFSSSFCPSTARVVGTFSMTTQTLSLS